MIRCCLFNVACWQGADDPNTLYIMDGLVFIKPVVMVFMTMDCVYFSQILRSLGGFFIRRRMDKEAGKKDHLYRAVLSEVCYLICFISLTSLLAVSAL